MANQQQLDILKQGVEAWNEWRKKNPDVTIDLNGYMPIYKATMCAAGSRPKT